jgi:guanylate kinase
MTSEDVIERRLSEARKELDRIRDYKYALVNDVLDVAVQELRAIVLHERGMGDGATALAESCRTDAGSPRLQTALRSFDRQSVS